MSKRIRWVLFYSAVVIFLILSYVMVVFALGYQYDFVANRFVRMGSLRVVTNTSAQVYINNKLEGGTSFLSNNFSKGRLLPRIYTSRIEKDGYHTWEKKITVVAGYFTDFPKIVLLPLDITEEPAATSSFGFPMETDTIRETKGKILTFTDHEISIDWTDNMDYQPYHQSGDHELITRIPQKITDVEWYKDRDHIFVAAGGILYFMEIDKRGGLNSYEITTLQSPFVYDADSNSIYKLSAGQVVRIKLP